MDSDLGSLKVQWLEKLKAFQLEKLKVHWLERLMDFDLVRLKAFR